MLGLARALQSCDWTSLSPLEKVFSYRQESMLAIKIYERKELFGWTCGNLPKIPTPAAL
jgi:hypothetical protein